MAVKRYRICKTEERQRTKEEEDESLGGCKLLAHLCVNSAGDENQRETSNRRAGRAAWAIEPIPAN